MGSKVFAGVAQKLISFLAIIPTMNNITHSCFILESIFGFFGRYLRVLLSALLHVSNQETLFHATKHTAHQVLQVITQEFLCVCRLTILHVPN